MLLLEWLTPHCHSLRDQCVHPLTLMEDCYCDYHSHYSFHFILIYVLLPSGRGTDILYAHPWQLKRAVNGDNVPTWRKNAPRALWDIRINQELITVKRQCYYLERQQAAVWSSRTAGLHLDTVVCPQSCSHHTMSLGLFAWSLVFIKWNVFIFWTRAS